MAIAVGSGFISLSALCTLLVPFTGIICRRPIDARDFAAHWSNVRAQLPAVVNGIEQCNPQQPTHRVFEQDLFRALNQPCLVVPAVVVQGTQLNCKDVMIALVIGDHLLLIAETRGVLPAQTAVKTFPTFAKLNTTLLGRNQESEQFSPPSESGDGDR